MISLLLKPIFMPDNLDYLVLLSDQELVLSKSLTIAVIIIIKTNQSLDLTYISSIPKRYVPRTYFRI